MDEYLEFCRIEGRTSNKPFKGSFDVRIGQMLHQRAARFAQEHDRKRNAVVVDALQQYLDKSA